MDEKRPLVSIIVRTKDRPKLLQKALASIAAQTYRPIEAVLVNDGGCELDVEELKTLLGHVSLTYVRLEKNTGRAHAGNVGIGNARGRYVGFLDDDDEFYPEHVEVLVSLLEKLDYMVAYSDCLVLQKEYDTGALEMTDREKELLFSRDFDYDFLLFENYIPFMCLLFRKDVLDESGGIDEGLELYEDWDLLIRIGAGHPFYHIRKTTACYNQWSGDMQIAQKNRNRHFVDRSYMKVLSKHAERISEESIRYYVSASVDERTRLRQSEKRREFLEQELDKYMRMAGSLEARAAHLSDALTKLESTVGDMEASGREKDGRIGELEAAVKEKEARLWQLDRDVREKDTSLQIIYNSRGWKALRTYYKVREKLFPPGSKRRLFAKLGLAAAGNPGAFVRSLNRRNVRKFIAQYGVLDPSVVESKVKMKMSLHPVNGRHDGTAPAVSDFMPDDNEVILGPPDGRNRVLVIDRWLPAYDKDSGALRMFSFLEILCELGYLVTFLPDDRMDPEPYAGDLRRMGVEVLHGNMDFENYMKKNGCVFSYVIMSRPEQAYKYMALMRAYAIYASVIYDTVDLHWVRFERTAAVTGDKSYLKMAGDYKAMELFNAMSADITFTVTGEEREILEKEIPDVRVEVVPNIHRVTPGNVPFLSRKDLMFIGGFFHQPNEDAVLYFAREILPLIREKLKGVRFFAVGSDPSRAVLELGSPDIIVTGYVRDVSAYFNNCRVFVSPLRYGAGMKGKIGQSMSYGLPVVTTTIGAEGMGLTDGENALVEDTPEAFADAVVRLYSDEALWSRISEKSMEHIEANYSKAALGKKIAALFESIGKVQVA